MFIRFYGFRGPRLSTSEGGVLPLKNLCSLSAVCLGFHEILWIFKRFHGFPKISRSEFDDELGQSLAPEDIFARSQLAGI